MRELDVRPADDPNRFNDPEGVFRQLFLDRLIDRQHRGGTEGVTRVDPHRIDVLDQADGDHLILRIADNLDLQLFPTRDRLFDQALAGKGRLQPARNDGPQLLDVVDQTATLATHRIGGPDDHRKSQLTRDPLRVGEVIDDLAAGRLDTEAGHRLFKDLAVLTALDRVQFHTDHLHMVAVQHT